MYVQSNYIQPHAVHLLHTFHEGFLLKLYQVHNQGPSKARQADRGTSNCTIRLSIDYSLLLGLRLEVPRANVLPVVASKVLKPCLS